LQFEMDSDIRMRRIDQLNAQLEASCQKCESLAKASETAPTAGEKAAYARSLEKALQQKHVLQLALVRLQRQQRESSREDATVRDANRTPRTTGRKPGLATAE
jgi:hypothetical protein